MGYKIITAGWIMQHAIKNVFNNVLFLSLIVSKFAETLY